MYPLKIRSGPLLSVDLSNGIGLERNVGCTTGNRTQILPLMDTFTVVPSIKMPAVIMLGGGLHRNGIECGLFGYTADLEGSHQ